MPNTHRLRTARLTAAAVVVTALSACASTGGRRGAERPADTAFVVSSPGWLHGTFEGSSKTPAPDACAPKPSAANPAIAPKSPWLGTVGVRQLLSQDWEVGLGVAVPNSYGPDAEAVTPPTDRFRGAAVGLWLKFDF